MGGGRTGGIAGGGGGGLAELDRGLGEAGTRTGFATAFYKVAVERLGAPLAEMSCWDPDCFVLAEQHKHSFRSRQSIVECFSSWGDRHCPIASKLS